jgi:type IV secretion system protein VirB9
MGDTTGWQMVPAGNRLFLKPVDKHATTNMLLITNKRYYHFELYAAEALDIRDDNLVFVLKFLYPDDYNAAAQPVAGNTSSLAPDMKHPERYNMQYTISGPEAYAPIQIFDDGEFTYFKFRDVNAEIPAFFLVDRNHDESLINYRVSDGYVIVERVASQFTLRHGVDIVCVFNERWPLEKPTKKSGLGKR